MVPSCYSPGGGGISSPYLERLSEASRSPLVRKADHLYFDHNVDRFSKYTVQNHLSRIFEKAGVRSRRAVAKRLFFENLYPALFG